MRTALAGTAMRGLFALSMRQQGPPTYLLPAPPSLITGGWHHTSQPHARPHHPFLPAVAGDRLTSPHLCMCGAAIITSSCGKCCNKDPPLGLLFMTILVSCQALQFVIVQA